MTTNQSRLRALLPLLLSASVAHATQAAPDEHRPPYAFLRQVEDWSMFVPADPAADTFDALKHIDLSGDGDIWLSIGGRVESRFELWRNFGFAAPNDDSFVVSRALVHADLHAGEHLRLYVEGKSAQATDRDLPGGRRTLDMDTLAVQQAFIDVVLPIGDSSLTLRPGRQMLLFGAQRLVSPLPWGNTLRTWEGLTGEWRGAGWSITGLATEFVPVDKTGSNEADDDVTLYGLYAKRAPGDGAHGLELYALGNERPGVTINGTSGDEQRRTYGARASGPMSGRTDYEVEGAWQDGNVGGADVEAWFLAAQAGWKPEGLRGAPRFWLGLDLASGDDDPGGDVGTFHQLFPLGHAYFGYLDAIGRQNIMDLSAGSKWGVTPTTSLVLALHSFRVLETSDALYDAGGVPYRTGFDSRDVGTELDLMLNRRIGRHVETYAGYSRFLAGDALEETGPAEDVDFVYFGVKYTF
jgi:hypothetical protein